MFKTRLLSGIILVALLLLLGIVGGDVLLAGLGAISLVGLFELYRVCKIEKTGLAGIGYVMTILYYFGLKLGKMVLSDIMTSEVFFSLSMAMLIGVMTVYVFTFPKYQTGQAMAACFGFLYVPVMLSCVYLTRQLPKGEYLVWLIFLCSWGCDTCAYCVGMLIGKHKMAPVLSPKKSVEGAVGGVVGAALLTVLYGFLFQESMEISLPYIFVMAGISVVGALISMVGDLAASAMKRHYEIKDYGTLIPGHGGILDRFDSVIFTAPMIYFLALYLM